MIPGVVRRAGVAVGEFVFVNVAIPLDKVLMPLTKGRLRATFPITSGLLICRGAKSGIERQVPLTYVPLEGDRIALIASKGGDPKHPSWYHNLVAYPEVRFAARGQEITYRARTATGAEREEIWARALKTYGGYAEYQKRTTRQIPVVVLDPV